MLFLKSSLGPCFNFTLRLNFAYLQSSGAIQFEGKIEWETALRTQYTSPQPSEQNVFHQRELRPGPAPL
jgi:hypothetical protein